MPKRKPSRRLNGEGSLYLDRRTGLWRAVISYTDPISGQAKRRYVSGKTAEVAREKLTKARRDLDLGIAPTAGGTTVEQYLGRWLTSMRSRVRPSTWRQHELNTRTYINPVIGKTALTKVTPSDVERMTARVISLGRSPMTARHARTSLRRALQDAMRDGLVSRNVASLAHPPRVERKEMSALSADEARRLIASVEDHVHGPLFTLAVTSGLRAGELLALRWSDVDLDAHTVTVRRALVRGWDLSLTFSEPKTRQSRRTVHIPDVTVTALKRQKVAVNTLRLAAGSAWAGLDLVFCDEAGQPLRLWKLAGWLSTALKDAGLKRVRFHDLRHSAASLWLQGGLPLKVVSEQMGHSNIAVTADVYAHVSGQQRQDAARVMERLLGASEAV